MLKKWLNDNKVSDFSFATRLFPKADDREFWEEVLNEELVKTAEEYLGCAWPQIRATQYMEFQKKRRPNGTGSSAFCPQTSLADLVCR